MPSFVEIRQPVLEKIFEVFLFTIYGHGGHFGHVAGIIYTYIGPPFLSMLPIKSRFD